MMNRVAFYDFQIAIELLSYEIERSSFYAGKCNDYYVILEKKIQKAYTFMTDSANLTNWTKWSNTSFVQEGLEKVRNVVVPALCNLEKYQAQNLQKARNTNDLYTGQLSDVVWKEMQYAHIEPNSKVLLIGSGAFPTTAIAIAKQTGAGIICADIDPEAVELGAAVVEKYGLSHQVHVSNQNSIDFAHWATHIIIASLVPDKEEILSQLWKSVNNETVVVLRFGNGLKSIFNFPFQIAKLGQWNIIQALSNQEDMYDSLILKKRMVN